MLSKKTFILNNIFEKEKIKQEKITKNNSAN